MMDEWKTYLYSIYEIYITKELPRIIMFQTFLAAVVIDLCNLQMRGWGSSENFAPVYKNEFTATILKQITDKNLNSTGSVMIGPLHLYFLTGIGYNH